MYDHKLRPVPASPSRSTRMSVCARSRLLATALLLLLVTLLLVGCKSISDRNNITENTMGHFNNLDYVEKESERNQQARVYSFRGTHSVPEVGVIQYFRPKRGADSSVLLGCLDDQAIITDTFEVDFSTVRDVQKLPEDLRELRLLLVQRARLQSELGSRNAKDEVRSKLEKEIDAISAEIKTAQDSLRDVVSNPGVITISGLSADALDGKVDGGPGWSVGGRTDSSASLLIIGAGFRMSRLVIDEKLKENVWVKKVTNSDFLHCSDTSQSKCSKQDDDSEDRNFFTAATTLIKLRGWTVVREDDLSTALGVNVRPQAISLSNVESLKELELGLGWATTSSLSVSGRPTGGKYTISSTQEFCNKGKMKTDSKSALEGNDGWKTLSVVVTQLRFLGQIVEP